MKHNKTVKQKTYLPKYEDSVQIHGGFDCFVNYNLAADAKYYEHRDQKKIDLEFRRVNRKADVTNAELEGSCGLHGLSRTFP